MAEGEPVLVVVADDERDIAELVAIVLGRAGYEVVTAADGVRALELVRERPPALAILDGTMPGLAGFEVIEAMRERRETSGVPVMVLTATVDEEREIRCHGVEPDGFMKKPFDSAELLAEVSRLVRR